MRAVLPFVIVAMAAIVLGACVQNPAPSGQESDRDATAEASARTGTDRLYEEMMTRILNTEYGWTSNNSNHRKGERNRYRDAQDGFAHKALAACLVWDVERLSFRVRSWNTVSSGDWSSAAFLANKNCRNIKRQETMDCTCQVVDHDDENLLEVPADYLAKYERKYPIKSQ